MKKLIITLINRNHYLCLLLTFFSLSIAHSQSSYEGFFLYIGNYPENEVTTFSEEAQGITHDIDHWYVGLYNFLRDISFFPRELSGSIRCRALRHADVDFRTVLHYWWPVFGRKDPASGADLGI